MNELTRVAYLEAMGIDTYVSRRQLPGAAFTRRLAVVSRPSVGSTSAPTTLGDMKARLTDTARASDTVAESLTPTPTPPEREVANLPRFSLSVIVAGQWLWLEDLGDMPLTVEQVRLVEAMARALHMASGRGDDGQADMGKSEVTQFDWPIHHNRQLELGEEAARAAVAGLVSRRLDQHNCAGLVLLGGPCIERVPANEIGARIVHIRGSLEILADPALKPEVWRELRPLVQAS